MAAIVLVHVACNGWVMARAWPASDAAGGIGRSGLGLVIITVALVVAAGSTAAAAGWSEPVGGWGRLVPARPGFVALGAAVTLWVPLVWGSAGSPAVWMYALPWGIGIASAGWLRGRPAVVAGVTVIVSAVVCALFVATVWCSTPPPVTD
ncbi:hypothetical protein [Actinoplanes sp. NPDC051494]|uniref:hypothetical protein n=1 Tax=Actinoplanes sp. NPDC051494 TaxID=3363907 RepID=UPI0037B21B83